MVKNWLLLQKPEDVLVLGAWVEKLELELEQAKPPSLPWDPGLLVSRDIDRADDAGANGLQRNLNLEDELFAYNLHVSLNVEDFNVCMSKWFYDIFIDTALEQPAIIRCWRGLGLSYSS
jgi:hypothetical protein